jgi:excisionase family DNA binding protein
MSSRKELNQDSSLESQTRARVTTGRSNVSEVSERLLTDRDVCSITGLDRVTLYRLRNANKIGFYKLGKIIRYSWEHVREFLEQHERQPKSRRTRTSR